MQDNEGRTPLTLATTRSSFISTAVLLDHGADPTIEDNYGKNYLHYYITHGLPLDCAYMKASISKVCRSRHRGEEPAIYSEVVITGVSCVVRRSFERQRQVRLHSSALRGAKRIPPVQQ